MNKQTYGMFWIYGTLEENTNIDLQLIGTREDAELVVKLLNEHTGPVDRITLSLQREFVSRKTE